MSQGELIGSSDTFKGNIIVGNNGFGIPPSVDFNQTGNGTYAGTISGAGTLIKDGVGTLNLTGDLSAFTGPFAINVGTVALQNTGDLHGTDVSLNNPGAQFDISGNTFNLATIAGLSGGAGSGVSLGAHTLVIANASATDIFGGTISSNLGGGVQLDAGTETFTGANSYSGITTINGGTLAFSGSGQIANSPVQINSGTLDVSGKGAGNHLDLTILQGAGNVILGSAGITLSDATGIYSGAISGDGTVTLNGGIWTLNGINTFTGLTTVNPGANLIVGDDTHATAQVGGDVNVSAGILGGSGIVQGSVTLSSGASLTPGDFVLGTLTINGDLNIGSASQLYFKFGAPGPNFVTPGQSDHVVVGGNLSIDSSMLNVNNLGAMGPGLYNLFTWGNTLSITGGGFAPPAGMSLQILTVDKQINLINTQGLVLDEWDANGLAGPGSMGGGSGTWSVSSKTWSDTNGDVIEAMSPQPGFAIFGGAAGTVTVDNSNGNVSVLGMQFVSDGYHLSGDPIDLVGQGGVAPVLRVSSGDTATIDNVLTGSSGINKTDGGTLVLNGANSYSGTTTLSGGYLSASADTNLGAAADALDFEGGTLEITGTAFTQTARNIIWGAPGGGFDIDDASNTFTVARALTGSGGLLKSGAGTLVLTGANTYSGSTVIGAGTLQGDTTSLQGNITDNAALMFNQNINGTYSSAISGSGSVRKSGAGLLILDGVNTYTGNTTVSAGTLEVGDGNTPTASISSNVTVGSGGTLRGHGSINGAVISDGIVWAGGSVGTLSIGGNYTQNADGTLRLDVTPTQASMLKVGGQANLAGALDLIFAPGTYGAGKYTLVQAGSLSGTFSKVSGTVPGAIPSQIAYTGTEADLVLAQNLGHSVVAPMDGSVFGNMLRGVALAGQRDMSSVLDVALLSGDTPCGGDRTPMRQNVSASCAGGAWAQYSGSALSLDGVDGMNSTAFGLLGGVDYAMGDTVHLGVQAGVGQINGNDKSGGSARAENVHGGVYAYANAGPIVLSALADWMHTDYHFKRASGIGAAVSAPGGQMLSGALQAAWPVQTGAWQLTPKLGVLFQRQTLAGFGETLSSVNSNAASFPVDGTRSRSVSLQLYAVIDLKNSFVARGVTYVPELSLGYRYNTHDPATPSVQVIAQDGTPFVLPGATQGRGFGTVNARITAQAGASWSVYMGYQGLFGSRLRDNALNFGFNKRF